VMAAIAVRRVRRLKSAQDDDSAHKPGGPIDPYNSMMGGGKK